MIKIYKAFKIINNHKKINHGFELIYLRINMGIIYMHYAV